MQIDITPTAQGTVHIMIMILMHSRVDADKKKATSTLMYLAEKAINGRTDIALTDTFLTKT